MKLTVVGGGSTYTPELADGLARLRNVLPVRELALVDPAADRLGPVAGLCRRILARHGHPGAVTATSDLEEGAADADAVLLQLRVGGQAARERDETWPLECGCVGQETTGAGGLAKALRTVPVVLGIAERVRRTSPGAWLVDFTNPVGIVTRALLDEGHRAVGLCNVAVGLQRRFAALLGVPPGEVHLDHAGLNHLTWELGVRLGGPDGEDALPRLLSEHGAALAGDLRLPERLLHRLGAVPSYYLRYFYAHDEAVAEARTGPPRAARVAALERRLLEAYGDPALDTRPALLAERGGAYYSEAAVALVAALLGGDRGARRATARAARDVQVVNARNGGALPFLPDDAVVEVPAEVSPSGAAPLPAPPLGPLCTGLVAHVAAYEQLALDAALRGGRDRVFAALLAHPLVGQYDRAEALTDRLVAQNREYLAWA